MSYPFPRARVKAKRTEPRRTGDRVILHGAEKTAERRRIFKRSGGKCEAERFTAVGILNGRSVGLKERCNTPITWDTMHMSHEGHGPRRDDRKTIASCEECHRNKHNAGGKPVPRKAGRTMNQKEALDYWKSTACFCGKEMKSKNTSFGAACMSKLSPQLQYDVMNATGEDYLAAMALAEQALLTGTKSERGAV